MDLDSLFSFSDNSENKNDSNKDELFNNSLKLDLNNDFLDQLTQLNSDTVEISSLSNEHTSKTSSDSTIQRKRNVSSDRTEQNIEMAKKQKQIIAVAKSLTPEIGDNLLLPDVHLVNIMASFTLGCDIDLRSLVISARNIEYNPRKLNAATIRFQKPRLSATVFACGRVNLCGSAGLDEIRYHAKFVTKLVKRCGHNNAYCKNLKIDSLSFNTSCGFPIHLESLAADHSMYCNYEPEIYCGLIYRYQLSTDFKATILIYVSGRLLITGCKKPSQANEVFQNLYRVLYKYRVC